MASSEPESYYRVALPNGLNVDVMTQKGADTFLQHNGSQQGFITVNMQGVRQLRQHLASSNLTAAQRAQVSERLVAIYTLFGFVADRASPEVFDAQVNKAELQEFLEHTFEILKKISNSKIWERSGLLQHKYDGEVLDTIVTFCKHEKFCQIHEEMGFMHFLAKMCAKRKQPRLVCPEFADYVLRITNNTNISQEIGSNKMSREKSYQKIEASGLLLQVLRVISLPHMDYQPHRIILDKLQSCPKLLRKTLCVGTPAREVVDDVLAGKNGYPKRVPDLVRKRLEDICRIADLASTPLQPKGRDIRFCRNCSKSTLELGMDTKLLVCSKCKSAYYCSRECQLADWKLHKKFCRVGSKVSKASEQTLFSYAKNYYYEIMTALYQKMQERGVPKTKLIVDLDFRNKIGSDESSAPALKGEFKVAVTEDYLNGRDAPAWFQDECDEASQNGILGAIKDHYQRELRSHILVLCRHAAEGGAGVFRLQLSSSLTMKPLFADELVAALGNRDWATVEQYLDPEMIRVLRRKCARDDMSESQREEFDDDMMNLMRRIRDFQASPQWDELEREAEAEGWDRDPLN